MIIRLALYASLASSVFLFPTIGSAVEYVSSPPVPGAGLKIEYLGDTFEDADWTFIHNLSLIHI